MSNTETLSARLQVLLTPAERQALQRLADKQERTASHMGRKAIQALLKGAKP